MAIFGPWALYGLFLELLSWRLQGPYERYKALKGPKSKIAKNNPKIASWVPKWVPKEARVLRRPLRALEGPYKVLRRPLRALEGPK